MFVYCGNEERFRSRDYIVGGTTITETATIDPPGSFPTGAALDKRYVTTETIVFGTTTIIETVTVDVFPTRR